MPDYKCHFCSFCNGNGCTGQLPGMGGVNSNLNFRINCEGWEVCRQTVPELYHSYLSSSQSKKASIRLAPITGGVENIGYPDEEQYYIDMISACAKSGVKVSIGDGVPDTKLQYGIKAAIKAGVKAAVFIKPYSNDRILERIEWAGDTAEYVGIDIDAYSILTMRNLAKLEQKTASQLLEIKQKVKVPFVLKGIYTARDLEIIRDVKPDVLYISNHGGRIDTVPGSTAEFIMLHMDSLKKYCGSVWVDGGIRTKADILTAHCLGAEQVLIGRPFITALCKNGEEGVKQKARELLQ